MVLESARRDGLGRPLLATVLGASAPPEGARRRVAPPQHPLSEPEAGVPRQMRLGANAVEVAGEVRGGCIRGGMCAPLVNPTRVLSGLGHLRHLT